MELPSLHVIDDALPIKELSKWQELVQTGTQSTSLTEEEVGGTDLYALTRSIVGGLPLIHCLLFEIVQGHSTELHKDVGEYVVLFYPTSNPAGPLRIERNGEIEDIEVKSNRLVALNCTQICHQQVVPDDGTIRHSVAFKFRLPTIGVTNDSL